MKTKTCFKCGIEKPLDDFYKHPQMADGHVNKCKDCNKKDVQENRNDNIEYYQEYDRTRGSLPHRVDARKEYAQTENGHRRLNDSKKRYTERNPDKKKAVVAVNNAVRDGRLIKQPCEVCGNPEAEGHHDDYTKMLDVRWLCDKHHKEHHKNLREKERLQYA